MKWLPSELCVGAFWASWSMRLIRLLYYDCRWVVKCSVLSSIGLCHSEKYCIRAGTGALSPSLFLIAALHPPYGKKVIFLRAALLTERSLRPSCSLLFFPVSLIVFGSFHPLYRSISLRLFILSKIRKVSLKCVISLTLTLSHSFSLSVVWKAWKVNSSPLGGNRLHTDSLCKTQIHILWFDGVRLLMGFYLWSV